MFCKFLLRHESNYPFLGVMGEDARVLAYLFYAADNCGFEPGTRAACGSHGMVHMHTTSHNRVVQSMRMC